MLKKYFGTKQFYREVSNIALPIMGQQFITTFVNLIDNVMIGSVGNIALTSVTVANCFTSSNFLSIFKAVRVVIIVSTIKHPPNTIPIISKTSLLITINCLTKNG